MDRDKILPYHGKEELSMNTKTAFLVDEEVNENMTATEMKRAKDWLKAKGLSSDDVCDFMDYVATGDHLPNQEDEAAKKSA